MFAFARSLVIAATCLVALAATVRADVPAELGLELPTYVSGKDPAQIWVNNSRGFKFLRLILNSGGARVQVLKLTDVGAGSRQPLKLASIRATALIEGQGEVTWEDGTAETFTLGFEVTRLHKLALDLRQEDVNLDARTLNARINNPAAKIELTVIGESGQVIDTQEETFDPPAPAGTPLTLSWAPPSEPILMLQLKITDAAGYWTGMKITPFSIEIPHDELVFDSGRSNVRADQASKLEATWHHIQDALKKHGTLLELKLFIAGFTDTVGPPASNQALSRARAASIAAWFRHRGLKIAIYYTGFGESSLAVPTPDETEEPRNRRAIYILATHTPTSAALPQVDWTRL